MRTERAILKRVKFWKDNPMLVSGVYRLFIYLDWSSIPEEYHEFFPKESKDTWDTGEDSHSVSSIIKDVKAEIYALIKVLAKKNVTHCLGMVPMIMADVFMCGKSTDKLQGDLLNTINNYKTYVSFGRDLAEEYATRSIIEILRDVMKTLRIGVDFDFDKAAENILAKFSNKSKTILTPEIDAQIDKVLDDYNKRGKDDKTDV